MAGKTKTKVGQLVIELQMKTEALEKGLTTAKNKLQEIEEKNKKVQNSNNQLDASFLAMAATAVVALAKIGSAIKSCVNEYNAYTQAMSSLQNVADYTGQSMTDFAEIMEKYSTFMTQSDIASTIKNFSLMGMTIEETDQMIQSLTNSAIKNRNANYTVSEAVKVASDGYKQGLSTLSDSAGVTENLSVMLDKYAQSIGKTASQLTELEKNQAYVNRTMEASAPFASAMSEYTDTLAGKQGMYAQAMRETQVAYAEALEPTLSGIVELITNVLNGIAEFIENNKGLIAGITATTTTLLALVAVLGTAKIAMNLLSTAMLINPFTKAIAIIATFIGATVGITTAIKEHTEAQEALEIVQARYNEVLNGTIELNEKNIRLVEQDKNEVLEKIELLKEYIALEKQMSGRYTGDETIFDLLDRQAELQQKLKENNLNWFSASKDLEEQNKLLDACNETLGEYEIAKKVTNALDANYIKNTQKSAAKLKLTVDQNQKYLDVIKEGNKSSTEYQKAQKALAEAYSEASTAEGIIIDDAQKMIDADRLKANSAWESSQNIIESYINIISEAKESKEIQEYVANQTGKAWEEIIPSLETVLGLYEILSGKKPSEIVGITPVVEDDTSKTSNTSYQNTALENYKKQIEYKKNLDKISAEEEIEMYEYALKNLAKISDEKMELEVQIYQLRKQLVEEFIDSEKKALDERTEASERWIAEQNLSTKEQEEAYERVIAYHKEYLDKMVADERLSLKQKDAIWKEEINIIKDYQKQIRDIRVETVDNVYEALKDALREQADQLQEIEEKAINKSLNSLENAKNKKIEMINEEYEARIKAIDDELKALEKAEEQKTRAEEEADYEKKKKRLEELIAYEHDTVTRTSYESELAKLNEEYQKIKDAYALEDKKEALNTEKETLKEEQQIKIDALNEKYIKEQEYLNNRLSAIQANYDREREMADKNAQVMLLNSETHQNEIITLLKTYGDEYELLGTTWGERVVEAFEEKIAGIVSTVESLNSQLQSAIDSKISAIANSSNNIAEKKAYTELNKDAIEAIAKANNVDVGVATDLYKNGVTITQTNNYNVEVEKPSTILQKTKSAIESLGELVRGNA